MLKIENHEVVGWEHAIRGMRNPKNSWGKSDSCWDYDAYPKHIGISDKHIEVQQDGDGDFLLGPNDQNLMTTLRNAGTDHRKFMRMITVYLDITAPLYWWKEFDTYKVGTVANSCSTMHKIADKKFTIEDFSIEHVHEDERFVSRKTQDMCMPHHIFRMWLQCLNMAREAYLETKDKKYWWTMIQLLPTSYNQKRTVMLNYEVLANIYKSRRHHKLDEWHTLCDWIESLPYSELITGKMEEKENEG
jgi:hypothetical protein